MNRRRGPTQVSSTAKRAGKTWPSLRRAWTSISLLTVRRDTPGALIYAGTGIVGTVLFFLVDHLERLAGPPGEDLVEPDAAGRRWRAVEERRLRALA